MIRLEMKNYNITLTEKQIKYLHYRHLKYEYCTGIEILPSDQRRLIGQAKFTYYLLRKALKKQIKTTEDQGIKQIKSTEDYEK